MNIIYNIYLNYILNKNTKNIKMIDTLKQTFLKGKYAQAKKHMEKYSTIILIRKNANFAIMKYYSMLLE